MVHTRISGPLNFEVFAGYCRELQANGSFRPSMAELVNLQDVTDVKISTAEITLLAKRQIFDAHARRALVAKSDLVYGICRMFIAFCGFDGEHNIRAFHHIDEGQRWVDGKDDSYKHSALIAS